jgi:hypothetical protein
MLYLSCLGAIWAGEKGACLPVYPLYPWISLKAEANSGNTIV